jgi:hypothetical protein
MLNSWKPFICFVNQVVWELEDCWRRFLDYVTLFYFSFWGKISTCSGAGQYRGRGMGGYDWCKCTPKVNPGRTLPGSYPRGATWCKRCKCEIYARLVEMFVENLLWSKRVRKCNIFLGLCPMDPNLGVSPGLQWWLSHPQIPATLAPRQSTIAGRPRFARPIAHPR